MTGLSISHRARAIAAMSAVMAMSDLPEKIQAPSHTIAYDSVAAEKYQMERQQRKYNNWLARQPRCKTCHATGYLHTVKEGGLNFAVPCTDCGGKGRIIPKES